MGRKELMKNQAAWTARSYAVAAAAAAAAAAAPTAAAAAAHSADWHHCSPVEACSNLWADVGEHEGLVHGGL